MMNNLAIEERAAKALAELKDDYGRPLMPLKASKRERRILAAERTAAMHHTPLEQHLKAKAEHRAATSGSRPCSCGTPISANKDACRTCAAVADLAMRANEETRCLA